MSYKIKITIFLAIVLAAAPLTFTVTGAYAQTPQIERIDVVDYGIYTATVISAQRDAQGILQSTSDNPQHLETTRNIPAQLGTRFGFRFTVVGTPKAAAVQLRKITIPPSGGLQNPTSNQPIYRSENIITATVGEPQYTAYKFDDPWELVNGTWTIEIWYGDRKLLSQSFTVFKPK
jgi:hypothetical protein